MAFVRQHPDYPKFRKKVGVMPDFSGSKLADQEQLIGAQNGVNRTFRFAHIPLRNSEKIYKNGMRMKRASNEGTADGDYYINYFTGEILFSPRQVPQPSCVIAVDYKYTREI
ncbi:hypothetical protein M3Y14_33775 (plasmid) [Bacillus thuringiensis]|uniref:hypothetical protein n=1 Tax=Bacillus thuringiensis TaxID=1428 RepID=UPI00222454D6|nr:hypothetical protein [Bacillus thuringiensis]UYX56223.1 hypothetical protein M3Y14_33775 [Bacillus thuringiensis]